MLRYKVGMPKNQYDIHLRAEKAEAILSDLKALVGVLDSVRDRKLVPKDFGTALRVVAKRDIKWLTKALERADTIDVPATCAFLAHVAPRKG